MRPFWLLLLAAACGRIGFEPNAQSGDGAIDAEPVSPLICSTHSIGMLDLGGRTATRLRATRLDSGAYVIAIGTLETDILLASLGSDLALESVHIPIQSGYTLLGVAEVASNLFVYANHAPTTSGYVKAVMPSLDTYVTAAYGAFVGASDPPLARAPDGFLWVGTFDSTNTQIHQAGADGVATGPTASYQPTYSSPSATISLGAAPDGVRAAVSTGGGTCETFTIAVDGQTSTPRIINDCDDARIAVFADGADALLYRGAAGYRVARLPQDANATATTIDLGDIRDARIVPRNDAVWMVVDEPPARIVRIDPNGAQRSSPLADLVPPFDLATDAAFWLDGGTLHVAELCP